jgi:hypothetical protein
MLNQKLITVYYTETTETRDLPVLGLVAVGEPSVEAGGLKLVRIIEVARSDSDVPTSYCCCCYNWYCGWVNSRRRCCSRVTIAVSLRSSVL